MRLKITANAPIVMQMPRTIGKCSYQLSSVRIGLVDDAFVLSIESVLIPFPAFSSVFHVDGVVTASFEPASLSKIIREITMSCEYQFVWSRHRK